jgi:hypothetical protein
MLTGYLGKIPTTKEKIQILFFVILGVFSAYGFAFYGWGNSQISFTKAIYFILLFYGIKIPKKKDGQNFRTIVILLLILPFVSIINSYFYYSQSPLTSISVTCHSFLWSLYFLLHKFKIKESVILRVFFLLAFCIVSIQIIQQITYPNVFWGVYSEDSIAENGLTEKTEMRNGLWRFRMHMNGYFTAPILFALWVWLKRRINKKLLIITLLFFISIYLTLTRQVMFACIIATICSFFLERKISAKAIFLIFLFIGGLFVFYDTLFSSLVEKTNEESTKDNIRIYSANYFWNESLRSPLTLLFGMGIPGRGAYEKTMIILNKQYGYYVDDVGFIGGIYEKGVIYVIVTYYLLLKIFFKHKQKIPTYIRMFVIYTTIMSPMIFPFTEPYMFVTWTMLLYICDLHINKSPLRLDSKKNINTSKKSVCYSL